MNRPLETVTEVSQSQSPWRLANLAPEILPFVERNNSVWRVTSHVNANEALGRSLLRLEKDPETDAHSRRVAFYTSCLALALELDYTDQVEGTAQARGHDVGKGRNPAVQRIIRQPKAHLTQAEREIVHAHTWDGFWHQLHAGVSERVAAGPLLHHSCSIVDPYPTLAEAEAAGVLDIQRDMLADRELLAGIGLVAICDKFDAMYTRESARLEYGHQPTPAEIRTAITQDFRGDPVFIDVFFGEVLGLQAA